MDRSSLRKVCPQCGTVLHVKRAVCGCGHAFPRKAEYIAKREAMKRKRTLESENEKLASKEQERLRKKRMRATETNEQSREQDKQRNKSERASETVEQGENRISSIKNPREPQKQLSRHTGESRISCVNYLREPPKQLCRQFIGDNRISSIKNPSETELCQ